MFCRKKYWAWESTSKITATRPLHWGHLLVLAVQELSGADALNDTISTALTLVCLLVSTFTGLDLDAYAGIVVAVLLLKTGYEGGKETLGQLLGQRPSAELAEKVRQMQKLDVILMRMNQRRERSVAITEHDPYYENVVRRVTLLKKGRR